MRYQDSELCDRLAGEYVLGTLKGAARRRFEALLPARPDLRRRVRDWEHRLSGTLGWAPPEAVPPQLWQGIEARLFPDAPTPARTPWYRRLWLWQGLSFGATGLATALAVLLLLAPGPQTPGYVVMVNDLAANPMWLISTASDMDRFYVKSLKPIDMPPKTRCVLWLKPAGSEQMYALGVLPDQGDERILRVDSRMQAMLPGQLMVTVEHMNGDMPDQPSAPPAYQGEWMPVKSI